MGISSYLTAKSGVAIRAQSTQISTDSPYGPSFPGGAFTTALTTLMTNLVGKPGYELVTKTHEDPNDPWWEAESVSLDDIAKVSWPVVHYGAWYDIFAQGTVSTFDHYQKNSHWTVRGTNMLIMGPNGHCFRGGQVKWNATVIKELTELQVLVEGILFRTFQDVKNDLEAGAAMLVWRGLQLLVPKVVWYVLGPGLPNTTGNYLTAANEFPTPKITRMYFQQGPSIEALTSAGTVPNISYVYDPSDPVPTIGGNNMGDFPGFSHSSLKTCGPWDQTLIGRRNDVLQFDATDDLDEELAITGQMVTHLRVSSNCTDTDFMVKVVDVFPNGTRLLVQDGVLRMRWREAPKGIRGVQWMVPNQLYDIEIPLPTISYIFPRGHRVGVDITSSNYPRFSVNRNNGVLLASNDPGPFVTAFNTIYAGVIESSYLALPIVSVSDLKPWHMPKLPTAYAAHESINVV
eukprot:NODE_1059_length_1913_cov_93.251397_g1008_i0.p1 GENE.NODE_1059_length_1913_cov_93.251397_g1008_i0~~NODE_1059_length_1913_cov_93.251397_g1008_i0.p1  ORF type:complete len:459 (+),score=49.74 NODE_1059_length_1913_cov_93.251397_g1008_i0:384-1760(+)